MRRLLVALILSCVAAPAAAQSYERLCDTELENCRAPIMRLIWAETQGIDVGFSEMSDARYSAALIKRFRAGVPVRVLMDGEVPTRKPKTAAILAALASAGIPMREKVSRGVFHWKMMLFHGQDMVEFSKANYTPYFLLPQQLGVSWFDEAVYFTNDSRLTNTFRTKFDDLWLNTTSYANYANVTGPLVRRYPIYPKAPEMNFPPQDDFTARSVARYNREPTAIDVIAFRIAERKHADALIAAVARGVKVRFLVEPQSYTDPKFPDHKINVERMYYGGVDIRYRAHTGFLHEAAVVLHGLGEVIFGSSVLSPASSNAQQEHNFFYHPGFGKPWFFQFFVDQFERKWNNTAAFLPFKPH